MRAALIGRHATGVATVCLVFALGSVASAQYFGRNKIRYREFDFQVLKTDHFDIYFYAKQRDGIEIAARLAERWYVRLERVFDYELPDRQPLVLYASHADFEQTNVIGGELSEGTGGLTEPVRRRIVLPLAGSISDIDHVIGHELVHAFQYAIAAEPVGRRGATSLMRLPLWFIEGMAEYVTLGGLDANAAMRVRDAAQRNQLPTIQDLNNPKYFPYHWGHAFFAYVAGRYGDWVIPQMLRTATRQGLAPAFSDVLGLSPNELSKDWHASIHELYGAALGAVMPPGDVGRQLIKGQGRLTELNIGPSLSPDGRWLAFLTSASLFSIDLYVADVETGRIARKLTSTANDAHYSSIQFIHSAGAWNASSERIALATVAGGRAALAIFDVRTGKRERDIVLNAIDEILNPSWSPDDRAIAFTGMRDGLTDLYVYDLGAARLDRLTRDAYADLHPAWAPDGRRIAFATDRFSSEIASLQMGNLQLAIADAQSGELAQVRAFGEGKHINPQWSSGGDSLYFVADPDGIANVYRLVVASREIEQITAVGTGVSGITASSPALSVSSGRLAVCVFEDDRYDIYIRQEAQPARPVNRLSTNVASLARTEGDLLAALLSHPDRGLPPPQEYPIEPYEATLSLAGIGQTAAGVGVGRYGGGVGGGAALFFSDFLGDQVLATAVQVNTGWTGQFSLNDIASEVGYFNLSQRWKWGIVGGQVPYVTGTFRRGLVTSEGGDPLLIDRQIIYRESQRSASAILSYPFDRTRRVEFRGGFARTSFEQLVSARIYSPISGNTVSETTETFDLAPHLNLMTSAAAVVRDATSFGPVSPVQGQRYRLEVSPTYGSINFTGVLVDYRRYVMPVSFYTIAARFVHYGRYGDGGDDSRLYPVYVNDPGFVRGYSTIYYATDCAVTSENACQLTSRFAGSRLLVGNVELRFPLLRPFGVTRRMYGPMPIELALFADTGTAWTGREKPALLGGSRPGISSAGVAIRMSMGFAVGEFDFVRPFQQPGEGWTFGFTLLPGW